MKKAAPSTVPPDNFWDTLDARHFIIIKGARVHNLKNVSIAIPRNRLVVFTGLSGSGKSSLAFDTLFAEGQRMYVESLSAYARQFLERMEKPDVDYIRGMSPAIAIEQRVNTRNPRSTVGTITEIYDYLKLLFSRVGKTYSPISGQEVKKDTVQDVVDFILRHEGGLVMIGCPLPREGNRSWPAVFSETLGKGFTRALVDGKPVLLEDCIEKGAAAIPEGARVELLIDRFTVEANNKDFTFRLSDSLEAAFFEGDGTCMVYCPLGERNVFSNRFERDGMSFAEPSTHLFSFNSPYGACPACGGSGRAESFSENLVIPNKNLSVYEGAVAPWRGKSGQKWINPLLSVVDFPVHRAYCLLTDEERDLLWKGNALFKGINGFFESLREDSYKVQNRVMMARYRELTSCSACGGTRLRKEASYVKVGGKAINELVTIPLQELALFFNGLSLDEASKEIAKRLMPEVQTRLDCALKMGLGYLTLNRSTATLSGGEFQRIKLTTALGSTLIGSTYVMDEPSIGLHPRDIHRMVEVLQSLRDLGNTVIVVEHEEEIIRAADELVDIGPEAGVGGGKLVFQGSPAALTTHPVESYTADYLTGKRAIALPSQRRTWNQKLILRGAATHNLHQIDVIFPLKTFVAVTGVSGSGKSTLVNKTLVPAILHMLGQTQDEQGQYEALEGDIALLSRIEFVNQSPIGRSTRSNPVSYVKAYDAIRELFAEQPLSVQRGYTGSHFSFNVEGGRCESCQGEGQIRVEMQFMADLLLPCEDCGGKRFKREVLEVTYLDKNIAEVLAMTVDEALSFFAQNKAVFTRLAPLAEVGLGYIMLGQSSNSLSGGEAQRVKLASFLGKKGAAAKEHILFVFDEPTTGLHFHDINKLLHAFNRLIEEGHSIWVIEHNIDVIKCADWIVDLGPESGAEGGQIVFAGTPEDMAKSGKGHTAHFLRTKLASSQAQQEKLYDGSAT